jgi:hypothetical protein
VVLAAVVAALGLAHLVFVVPALPGNTLFNLDREDGVGTWVASALLAAAALAALAVGHVWRASGRRWRPPAVLGSLLLLLSVEEVAALHERVSEKLASGVGAGGEEAGGTPLIGLVATPFAVAGLVLLLRALDEPVRRAVGAGVGVWWLGTFGVEQLEVWALDRYGFEHEVTRALWGVQETAELAGAAIVLVALLAQLSRAGSEVALRFSGPTRRR